MIYTFWLTPQFKSIDKSSRIIFPVRLLKGQKYITIGNNTTIGSNCVLTAWDKYGNDTFNPEIIIGKNVNIGDDCHITAINKIEIGDNVLTGKKITISDNGHGKNDLQSLSIPPIKRALYSKAPVIIEKGVWIGDKVTILAGVKIGENSIIGANSVVTSDIPCNCIAAGIPAKILKNNNI